MTQVVTVQPTATNGKEWNSGVFQCFEDIPSCLFGALCPCILLCNISNRMDEGYLYPCCCGQVAPLTLRAKLRTQENIQGSLCNDAIIGMCFLNCALCQMDRQLKSSGK
ncbi:cornifelin homolog B-like [Montipora capricornis]|uniref:cornifelin homolog B-like n=1 Tax=Montipora capricornis TaxID=246305 RepID=UPI0035F1CAFA